MLTTRLNNGVLMLMLGFGVYQISDANECEQAVSAATCSPSLLVL